MYDTASDVLEGLRSTPAVLERLVQLPASRDPAGWAPAEIIWHLRDVEEQAIGRMRAMRDQERPFLAGYDQEAWARERRYAERDPGEGARQFAGLRRTFVRELEALAPAQWERRGQHEEVGEITILNQAIHLVGHDVNHLAQLAALLS